MRRRATARQLGADEFADMAAAADRAAERADGLAGLSPSARALATRWFDSAESSEYIGG